MTRKRFNVVTIAAMIAILALGSLGLGYAAWQDQIELMDATVTTGNMNVRWNNVTLTEDDDLNVASCTFTTGEAAHVLDINIAKAYPGYSCAAHGFIQNNGDVPVMVTDITVVDGSSDDVVTFAATCAGLAEGAQIAAGASIECDASVTVHENAAEGTPYTSSVVIDFGLPIS